MPAPYSELLAVIFPFVIVRVTTVEILPRPSPLPMPAPEVGLLAVIFPFVIVR
jgi:hypothetical protein